MTARRPALVALLIVAVLSVLDVFLTRAALGPHAVESNPLTALMIHGWAIWALKVAPVVGMGWIIWRHEVSPVALYGLCALAGYYFAVCLSNALVLARVA